MNLLEMTRGGNSKYSQLSVAVSPSDTSIAVQDISYFTSTPNYATIGVDNDAEVIYYTGIDTTNSLLTGCVRGESGTVPNVWPVSTYVYNAITSTLINNMEDNITTLSEVIGGSGLLINSNFSVWQRATSYTVTTTANYGGPDRWKFMALSGSPVISQLTATSGLKCTGGSCTVLYLMDAYDLANVQGQICTLSYKLNGAIKTSQITPTSQTVLNITLANGDQLEWVKLELGAQSTQYIPNLYAEELWNCYSYFIKNEKLLYVRSPSTNFWIGERFRKTMRAIPSSNVTLLDFVGLSSATQLHGSFSGASNNRFNYWSNPTETGSQYQVCLITLDLDAEL